MLFSPPRVADTLNGILISALFALSAMYIGSLSWMSATGLSPLILAIFMGMIYANTLRHKLPAAWVPGVQFTARNILRLSIVLYGFRLTYHEIAGLGWQVLALDFGVILSTLGLAWLVGTKLLGMDRDTSLLVGAGSGICGAAAVMAAEGTLQSESHKSAAAVATVVIFGTLAMLLYPLAQTHGWLNLSDRQFGIWSGATIHEVAQVVAAGNMAGGVSGADAVLVKMGRVLLMAPVLLLTGWVLQYFAAHGKAAQTVAAPPIPWFIVWFIAVVALHSMHIVPEAIVNAINQLDQLLLVAAMAALGIESTWQKISVSGPKAFLLAGILFVWLSVGGWIAVRMFF
ncbi:MAG: YeiH family protein [Sulfuriferula sp.]|nr:YeiH family protein [Sulfuriferula sp.]